MKNLGVKRYDVCSIFSIIQENAKVNRINLTTGESE